MASPSSSPTRPGSSPASVRDARKVTRTYTNAIATLKRALHDTQSSGPDGTDAEVIEERRRETEALLHAAEERYIHATHNVTQIRNEIWFQALDQQENKEAQTLKKVLDRQQKSDATRQMYEDERREALENASKATDDKIRAAFLHLAHRFEEKMRLGDEELKYQQEKLRQLAARQERELQVRRRRAEEQAQHAALLLQRKTDAQRRHQEEMERLSREHDEKMAQVAEAKAARLAERQKKADEHREVAMRSGFVNRVRVTIGRQFQVDMVVQQMDHEARLAENAAAEAKRQKIIQANREFDEDLHERKLVRLDDIETRHQEAMNRLFDEREKKRLELAAYLREKQRHVEEQRRRRQEELRENGHRLDETIQHHMEAHRKILRDREASLAAKNLKKWQKTTDSVMTVLERDPAVAAIMCQVRRQQQQQQPQRTSESLPPSSLDGNPSTVMGAERFASVPRQPPSALALTASSSSALNEHLARQPTFITEGSASIAGASRSDRKVSIAA